MFLFLVTPCLVVAVHPCMEWIPVKKKDSLSCKKLTRYTFSTFPSLQPSSPLSCSLPSYKNFRIKYDSQSYFPLFHSITYIMHTFNIRTEKKSSKFFRATPSPVPLKIHLYVVKNYILNFKKKIIWLHNYQHDKSTFCNVYKKLIKSLYYNTIESVWPLIIS